MLILQNPAEQYYDPQAAAAMSSYYQMYQQQAQQQMYADQFAFNHFGYGQMAPLNPNSAPFQMPDASAVRSCIFIFSFHFLY